MSYSSPLLVVGGALTAILLGLSSSAVMADPKSTLLAVSSTVKEENHHVSSSLTHAFNGDFSKQGVLLRAGYGFGKFEFDRASAPGGRINADSYATDLLVGYQWVMPAVKFRLYAGGNHQDRQFSPAGQTGPSEGSRTGLKIYGQAFTDVPGGPAVSVFAYYATALDNYYASVRAGWDVGGYTIGPQVTVLGSDTFDSQRLGLFLSGMKLGEVEFSLSGGYAYGSGDESGKDSTFLGLSASVQF